MTFEQKAQALADALYAAEAATATLSNKMRDFVMDPAFSGDLTRKTFIRRAQGVEGEIGQLHLDITPFDPRPRPRDGGGK